MKGAAKIGPSGAKKPIGDIGAPGLTAGDLMELVNFTELKDGRWKAVLDAGTGGKLSLTGKTLPGASRAMQTLCTKLAVRLEAARHDARQADGLLRKILTSTKH